MESTRAMTLESGSRAEAKNCEILFFPTADRRFERKVKCPTGRASFWVKFPFRTEKEVYLWRYSTISDRIFHKNSCSISLSNEISGLFCLMVSTLIFRKIYSKILYYLEMVSHLPFLVSFSIAPEEG